MQKRISAFLLLLLAVSLCMGLLCSASAATGDEVIIDVYKTYTPPEKSATVETDVSSIENKIADVNSAVNSFAWGPIMLVLLVGTGIFFTVRCGFFSFTNFGHVLKNTIGKIFKKDKQHVKDHGAITPFQALTTAMAATVGTGNIAGVTGAIILGGPGAIFWMWLSALFGMMTKFAEVVLAVRFRERNAKGEWVGGPMYYIKNGLGKNWAWLGIIFSALGALAAFGIGNMTQVNTIAGTIVTAVDALTVNPITGTATESIIRWVTGIAVAAFIGVVVIGGLKRIGTVTEKLVPFMSAFYILGSLIIVFANIDSIGPVLGSIFQSAFAPRAAIGGVGGFVFMNAVKRGVSRGVFSNEAGLGSAPIAHASTSENDPIKQGLYGIFEVFMDTIVICTLTALVVLMSGVIVPWGNGDIGGATIVTNSFATLFGTKFASIFVAIAILCFASSTVISWQLYGQRCFAFLTGGKGVIVYQVIFVLFIVVGATMNLQLAWDIADTLNGLMAIPNLIAVLGLSGVVVKLLKEYKFGIKAGK